MTKRQALLAIFGSIAASVSKDSHAFPQDSVPRITEGPGIGRISVRRDLEIYLADPADGAVNTYSFVFHYRGQELRFTAQDIWDALQGPRGGGGR